MLDGSDEDAAADWLGLVHEEDGTVIVVVIPDMIGFTTVDGMDKGLPTGREVV